MDKNDEVKPKNNGDCESGEAVVIKVGYEEAEVWPERCSNQNRTCLQCWLNGKVMCSPRAGDPRVRVPKKVMCNLEGSGDDFTFQVDENGWCRCGESIVNEDGEICALATEVLEWQDIQPAYHNTSTIYYVIIP